MKDFYLKQLYKVIWLTFLLIFLLASCQPTYPSPTLGETETLQPSATPFLSEQPGNPPVLTITRTPIATKTVSSPTANTPLFENCATISSDFEFTGDDKALLFDQLLFPTKPLNHLSILQIKNGKSITLEYLYSPIATSPDFTKIAYINQENQLIVSDSNGTVLDKLQGAVGWAGVVDWFDNQTQLIQFLPTDNGKIYRPASILRYNTQDGSVVEYISNYPELVSLAGGVPNWGANSFSLAVYNNEFSRVVYLAWNNDDDGPIILMNMENKQEILRLHGNDFDYGGGPQWLSDGSAFVVAVFPVYTSWREKNYVNFTDNIPYEGGYELALVGLDGEVKRLTYLTREFIAGEEGISLSPNNKKVAFWLNLNYKAADRNAFRQLAVLDIASGEVTNLCLPGGDFPYPPVWSMDEKYLLATVSNTAQNESKVYLIDLENNKAKIVAENAIAVAWLIK